MPRLKWGDLQRVVEENETLSNPLSPRDLAQKFNVKPMSIHRTKARLRRLGRIAPAGARPIAPRPPWPPPGRTVTEAEVLRIANSDVMDKGERLRSLSDIAKSATDNVRVVAIRALEELERGTGTHIGPPIPLTQDEQVERLARLLTAVGPETAALAYKKSLQEAIRELPQETSQIDSRPADGDSSLGGLDPQN